MLANILITIVGVWGCYYTWTRRSRAGSEQFFDFASPVKYPRAYIFTITLRLVIFGLGFAVGIYRIIFNITH